MLENTYFDQYKRVLRFFEKIQFDSYGSVNYDDNLYAFFQNAWHLKDWIKNDENISENIRNSIEKTVKQYHNIRICSDIANKSKHLKLTRNIKVDAEIVSRSVTVNLGDLSQSTCSHKIVTEEGKEFIAQEVAKLVVEEWKDILASYNLKVEE